MSTTAAPSSPNMLRGRGFAATDAAGQADDEGHDEDPPAAIVSAKRRLEKPLPLEAEEMSGAGEVDTGQSVAPDQGDEAAEGEIRTEGDGHAATVAGEQDQDDADHGADAGREQDDRGSNFHPSQAPIAASSLKSPIAHAFLAGQRA